MARFTGIHHPAFVTRDMNKTIRFWRDLVGLKLVYTLGGDNSSRQYFFALDAQNFIVFFEWPEAEPVPYRRPGEPVQGPRIFDHLAIRVAGEEDLWEIVSRLEEAEIPISDVVDHGWVHSVYTFDPNGLPVEFLHQVGQRDIASDPLFTDSEAGDVAREGAQPIPSHWPDPQDIPEEERLVVPGEGHEHRELFSRKCGVKPAE